jgi:hypothetical protein
MENELTQAINIPKFFYLCELRSFFASVTIVDPKESVFQILLVFRLLT